MSSARTMRAVRRCVGRRRKEHGQSIVELIVVSALLVLLTGATLSVLHSMTATEHGQQAKAITLDEMRSAMARVTRDVRQATSIDASSVRARLQMQTRVGGSTQTVVYEVTGDALVRAAGGGGTETLLTGIADADVFCYDPPTCSPVTPTTSPTVVEIVLNVEPSDPRAAPIALTTDVSLRNVGA